MPKRARDPVPWIVGLFAANFLLQRISVPNLSIPVIVPLTLVWVLVALRAGVVSINARRLVLWLLAASVSGLLVTAQLAMVRSPYVSTNSWALWIVLWLPLVVHLRAREVDTYRRSLRGIGTVGLGIATLTLMFTVVQYLGFPYRDLMAEIVPRSLLVDGYVVSYPVTYGSEIYKSNAWLGLEPSFVSFMLGVCVVAAVVAGAHWVKVCVLLAAMLATTAGSGVAIVLAFIALTVLSGRARSLRPYAVPALVISAVSATTLLGQSILGRVSEVGQSRSSTSLRMIEPYKYLWPQWTSDPWGVLVGRGPGSSAWVVGNSGIDGLLVPSVAKVFFDYGLIGGVLLALLVASAFIRTPEPRFAAALAISMFTVQSASPPLVVCVFLVASFWAPARLPARREPARRWRPTHAADGRKRSESGVYEAARPVQPSGVAARRAYLAPNIVPGMRPRSQRAGSAILS